MARLTAIDENTDLGSGMRVAMRNLEIRGAGSILGAEQSGNMSAVGFDLFAQMLAQAVNMAREGTTKDNNMLPPALSDIVVNVPDHTYIPEEYVPDTDERVLYYRKIASADEVEVVDALQEELIAKHGEMPPATINLFDKARLKALANQHGIKTISVTGGKVVIDPISISRSFASSLRRRGGRYLEDKKKLTVPLRVIGESDDGSTLIAIYAYIARLFDEEADKKKS